MALSSFMTSRPELGSAINRPPTRFPLLPVMELRSLIVNVPFTMVTPPATGATPASLPRIELSSFMRKVPPLSTAPQPGPGRTTVSRPQRAGSRTRFPAMVLVPFIVMLPATQDAGRAGTVVGRDGAGAVEHDRGAETGAIQAAGEDAVVAD